MTVSDAKNYILLVSFANSHPMVSIDAIELDQLLSPAKQIQSLTNQRKRIPILNG